jgi:hypothetical protein
MFMLNKIPKAYLIVDNYSQKVTNETKEELYNELKSSTNELQIDTEGFSQRSLGFFLYETAIDNTTILNIEMGMGETSQRKEDSFELFGLTYLQRYQIFVDDKSIEDINDLVYEKCMILLDAFKEQYIEDNKKQTSANFKSLKSFANEYNYEIDYKKAVQRAKAEQKDILFVMVANFCPWCIKLEKIILEDPRYNKMIHEKYIPLILNREQKDFPKRFDNFIVPVVYLVDYKTEKIKKKVIGYNNRYDVIDIIEK